MSDRWTSLMRYASEAESCAAAFYRWVDQVDQPVNADEYRHGREVFLLWEDADGNWVIGGASRKAAAKHPVRLFSTKQEAQAELEAQGCSFTRNWPVYKPA